MSRLTDEQEIGRRTEADQADTPEERERRIQRLIARYEREGIRGHQGPCRPLTARTEAEMERRRERDAQCLAMRRAGADLADIANAIGMGRTTVHEAIKRAEERERRAADKHITMEQAA